MNSVGLKTTKTESSFKRFSETYSEPSQIDGALR